MSVIYDALKKLQEDVETRRHSQKNSENSQPQETSSVGLPPDTAIFPKPRISKSLIKNAKPANETTKSEYKYTKLNSTIPAALKSAEEKRYQKIIIALCSVTCIVLLSSIGYNFYMLQASRSASAPAAVATKKIVPEKKSIDPIALQGIMAMGDRQVALINDEIYEVGESVKGRKIVAISVDSIQILDHRKVKTLYVKQKKK